MQGKNKFLQLGVIFGICLLTITAPCLAQVSVETPRGGWRNSEGAAAGFAQQVHYPAASVNAEGHATAALIKGQIREQIKEQITSNKKNRPAKLIANGIAIPLKTDEAGNFSRPYAFSAGSNNIEIRSADGKTRRQVQFFESDKNRPQAKLRVVLSWDSDGTDLDLHVVSPDGEHVFYGQRVANNGGSLDVDVTTGYGPEIYANVSPPSGIYHIYVNYYGSGDERQSLTTAQVAIISQEGTISEKRQIAQVPMRKAGELTLIKSFSYP